MFTYINHHRRGVYIKHSKKKMGFVLFIYGDRKEIEWKNIYYFHKYKNVKMD